MSEFTYKAYISYSHADAKWAAWLQRALETYRVPRTLLADNSSGARSRQLSPIFRDKEDLSSANRLNDSLQSALRQSEYMIVLCSPAAAGSRWVNEEIRYFRSLGRSENVFCMLVDGDLDNPSASFPAALFDGIEDGSAEPLASDPRSFADGKTLAKQKLVAGILGVRLDELRRRDQVRKRRWQVVVLAALLGVIGLAAITVTSRIAEQAQRENAEQMATFIVDLGEELRSEISLDARAAIGQNAMRYLEGLNPDNLSPETSLRVGQAIRQVGQVNQDQGNQKEALDAFLESRDWFEGLVQRFPQHNEALFEFGQAEFFVSYHHFLQQNFTEAWRYQEAYSAVARQMYVADPDEYRWLLELSYAQTAGVAMWLESGLPLSAAVLQQADEAVQLAATVAGRQDADSEAISQYAVTLAWSADAHMQACELESALGMREKGLDLSRRALELSPSDYLVRADVAFAASGLSYVLSDVGRLEDALRLSREASEQLHLLWRQDLSNHSLRQDYLQKTRSLADLLIDLGELAEAEVVLSTLNSEYSALDFRESTDAFVLLDYQGFLLTSAQFAHARGNNESARAQLAAAMEVEERIKEFTDSDSRLMRRNATIGYEYWRLSGEIIPGYEPFEVEPSAEGVLRNCAGALANAQAGIVTNNDNVVNREIEYLLAHGFQAPDFVAFCAATGRCIP